MGNETLPPGNWILKQSATSATTAHTKRIRCPKPIKDQSMVRSPTKTSSSPTPSKIFCQSPKKTKRPQTGWRRRISERCLTTLINSKKISTTNTKWSRTSISKTVKRSNPSLIQEMPQRRGSPRNQRRTQTEMGRTQPGVSEVYSRQTHRHYWTQKTQRRIRKGIDCDRSRHKET